MKIKTSELEGAALDWAMAEALPETEYQEQAPDGSITVVRGGCLNCYHAPQEWKQGGELIERYGVSISPDSNGWVAALRQRGGDYLYGDTPLIAAMRAIVSAELGNEVDVPEDLA